MPEVVDNVVFLADLNQTRPWWRERVPGLRELEVQDKIILLDIFEAIGFPELSHMKLYLRRETLSRHDVQAKILDNLIALTAASNSKRILFSTLDNCLTFLTEELVYSLKEKGIVLGCVFGDDELNFENYKFFLRLFDFVVVYLDEYAMKYGRVCSSNYFVQGNCYSEVNRIVPAKQENKIAFVGSPFKRRVELIRSLVARNVSIDIYGPPKRWRNYQDLMPYFKGYMDADKFFETLNSYAFTYCSIIDMNGKKHMNTKVWESLCSGSYPLVEHHNAFENQFGLSGELKLEYISGPEDIERMLGAGPRSEKVSKIQSHLASEHVYEKSYAAMIEAFLRSSYSDKKCSAEAGKSLIGAVTLSKGMGYAGFPWLILPGVNIYHFDGQHTTRCSFLKSVRYLLKRRVQRTNYTISANNIVQIISVYLQRCITTAYLIAKRYV